MDINIQASCKAIGIDLGTTFSSVAVYKNGKPEIIGCKMLGEHLVPSEVFFNSKNREISVGKLASTWSVHERTNFIYDCKRVMGRKYDDVYVQDLINNGNYPYKIIRGRDDNAAIQVKQNNDFVEKLPEEIGSEILKYLRDSASEYLGETVTEAVVSVPAHFSNAQRKATLEAARLAGLTVLKLISEPVAAAIYYNMSNMKDKKSTLLIVDIGGGTLDVTVVDVDNNQFKVRGLEGDSFLGGRDFDHNLMNYFISTLSSKTKNKKINARHLERIKKQCTKIKILLSVKEETEIDLDHFGIDEDCLPLTISRQIFESLNCNLFNRIMDVLKLCLADIGILKDDIDKVVLVGGSSRIPKIREMLISYFGANKLKFDVNPDEAVALGAAIQAAVLSDNKNNELERYKITEIAPLSIGIRICGNVMEVVIPKNTPLPASSKLTTVTSLNDQKIITKSIYEGERKNCNFNTLLGTLILDNLPPGKAASVQIENIFNLSEDGILTVESSTFSIGTRRAVITLKEHRLCENELKRTFADAERFKKEDELFERYMKFLSKSKRYCYNILYDLSNVTNMEKQNRVKQLCNEYVEYAKKAEKNEVNEENLNKVKSNFKMFKCNVQPLIHNLIFVIDYSF